MKNNDYSSINISITKRIIGNVWCWCSYCMKCTGHYWTTVNGTEVLICTEHEEAVRRTVEDYRNEK